MMTKINNLHIQKFRQLSDLRLKDLKTAQERRLYWKRSHCFAVHLMHSNF
jgi:phage-related minor tail protein